MNYEIEDLSADVQLQTPVDLTGIMAQMQK